jgi:putative transposase
VVWGAGATEMAPLAGLRRVCGVGCGGYRDVAPGGALEGVWCGGRGRHICRTRPLANPVRSPARGGIFVEPDRLRTLSGAPPGAAWVRKKLPQFAAERYGADMGDTYTQIYIQVVFAVEGRQNLIAPEHSEELQKYITGIVSRRKEKLLAINNMPDHVHLLVGFGPDRAFSELVRDVKANSSRFINEKRWVCGKFSWQEGFGAFSYSRSQIPAVIGYIQNQQRHHARRSFSDEYIAFLRKFDVAYDERYVLRT